MSAAEVRCRHGRTLVQGCQECLGPDDWHLSTTRQAVAAERVRVGDVLTDERWSTVLRVGHVTIGPKWVTFRAFHPEAHVYPNTPRRVRRGELVDVRPLTDV